MDPTWKEETREAKNNVAEKCDLRTEDDGDVVGRGAARCPGQEQMEADSHSLMFHLERRGLSKKVKINTL